jgi:hypothetical protein
MPHMNGPQLAKAAATPLRPLERCAASGVGTEIA